MHVKQKSAQRSWIHRLFRQAGGARWLSMVVLLALLAGCAAPVAAPIGSSSDGEAAAAPVEIVMWRFPLMDDQEAETAVWDEMIADFTAIHPNVTINIEVQPWDDRHAAAARPHPL